MVLSVGRPSQWECRVGVCRVWGDTWEMAGGLAGEIAFER